MVVIFKNQSGTLKRVKTLEQEWDDDELDSDLEQPPQVDAKGPYVPPGIKSLPKPQKWSSKPPGVDSVTWNKFGTDKQKRDCVKEYLLANPNTPWRPKLKSYLPIEWVEPSLPKPATLIRHSVSLSLL